VLTCGALALAAAVSAGTGRTFDRGGQDTASLAPASTVAVGAPAQNLIPLHSTTAVSGRLTVYLVGSPAEAGAGYERSAADQEFRAQNWAPSRNPVVVVAGSPDEERCAGDWVVAVREGLGVPVDVIDLRRAPFTLQIVPAMAPTVEGVPQPAYADWQINEMTARHPEP
jgi:hypothetical protein